MSTYESERRRLLRALLALPIGYATGCRSESDTPSLSPEESLASLILLLGPWPDPPGPDGDRFVARFMDAPYLVGKFLPGASEVIQRLAARFENASTPEPNIDLTPLSEDERALLLTLARELYSLNEIQRLAANQPPYGECQDDGTWHTQPPKVVSRLRKTTRAG